MSKYRMFDLARDKSVRVSIPQYADITICRSCPAHNQLIPFYFFYSATLRNETLFAAHDFFEPVIDVYQQGDNLPTLHRGTCKYPLPLNPNHPLTKILAFREYIIQKEDNLYIIGPNYSELPLLEEALILERCSAFSETETQAKSIYSAFEQLHNHVNETMTLKSKIEKSFENKQRRLRTMLKKRDEKRIETYTPDSEQQRTINCLVKRGAFSEPASKKLSEKGAAVLAITGKNKRQRSEQNNKSSVKKMCRAEEDY